MTDKRRRWGAGNITKVGTNHYRVAVSGGKNQRTGKYVRLTRTVRGTRSDAEATLRKLHREVEAHRDVDGSRKPLSEVLDEWLAFRRPHLSPSTAYIYEVRITRHVAPHLGHIPVGRLTARDIDRFLVAYQDEGHSASSARAMHATLRSCLTQAMKWGYVERNVASLATPPPSDTAEVTPATVAEVRLLLDAAEAWSPAFATLIWVVANTGIRRGEVAGLRWGDVDWTTATLTIARSVVQPGASLHVKEPKTRSSRRRLALDEVTVAVLARHRQWCELRAADAEVTLAPDAYLFSDSPDGSEPAEPNRISQRFASIARPLGLRHVHLHSLRHTVATILLAGGVDMRTVMGRLGHASVVTTTSIYGHVLEAADRSAANVLGALLAPTTKET